MTLTGDGITYFQLATLKSQLRMEKVGLTHSAMKGRKLRPLLAKGFGLKPRADYELYIAEVQSRMDAMLKQPAEGLHSQSV